ncbi:MAG: hypothetical protein L3J71_11320 [Victivallaceae bacterium]|nr:hypothetical protein [Victivallaceae bacterium]
MRGRGCLLGAFLTLVIQSSFASIGIIMVLTGSGLINFYTAMPLMLGGKCRYDYYCRILAVIPANRWSK